MILLGEERVQGDPRGPGGPPHFGALRKSEQEANKWVPLVLHGSEGDCHWLTGA